MTKWTIGLGLGLVSIVALVAIVAGIGALLDRGHVATRAARYAQSPETIWSAIADFDAVRTWWKDGEDVPLRIEESTPPRRLVTRIADPDLPFGGTWTYEITPDGNGCRLRLTERGEIYNPIFRFVSRFLIGYHATMESYLTALGAKFGETVTLEP